MSRTLTTTKRVKLSSRVLEFAAKLSSKSLEMSLVEVKVARGVFRSGSGVLSLLRIMRAPTFADAADLQLSMPSDQVCSNFGSPGFPQFLNQEPPRTQQVGFPALVVPHLGHAIRPPVEAAALTAAVVVTAPERMRARVNDTEANYRLARAI